MMPYFFLVCGGIIVAFWNPRSNRTIHAVALALQKIETSYRGTEGRRRRRIGFEKFGLLGTVRGFDLDLPMMRFRDLSRTMRLTLSAWLEPLTRWRDLLFLIRTLSSLANFGVIGTVVLVRDPLLDIARRDSGLACGAAAGAALVSEHVAAVRETAAGGGGFLASGSGADGLLWVFSFNGSPAVPVLPGTLLPNSESAHFSAITSFSERFSRR